MRALAQENVGDVLTLVPSLTSQFYVQEILECLPSCDSLTLWGPE